MTAFEAFAISFDQALDNATAALSMDEGVRFYNVERGSSVLVMCFY